MKALSFISIFLIISISACKKDTPVFPVTVCGVVSYAGIDYPTVIIGSQCWFSQNLNVGVPGNIGEDASDNNIIEKYCYNDDETNCDTDGGLYTWDEMMNYVTEEGAQGICPEGWHIPTKEEFEILIAAAEFKPELLFKNGSTGFEVLLSGYGNTVGDSFVGKDMNTRYYSSTEKDANLANRIGLQDGLDDILVDTQNKKFAYSVRCIKN